MRIPTRRRPAALSSLLVTLALAGGLGLIVYLSITSLPYLAVSPTTDPTFGALNACMLEHLPERTGFAVSRDATRVAAWSHASLVECGPNGARVLELAGLNTGAYDTTGSLWLSQQSSDVDAPRVLFWNHRDPPRPMGPFAVQSLTALARGIALLEPDGHLLTLTEDGAIASSYELPSRDVRTAIMSSSADATRFAIVIDSGIFAFTSTLELLRAEAPCNVDAAWWHSQSHRLVLQCSDSLALDYDVDTGRADVAEKRTRSNSTLVGPMNVWVQACDVLPCTAVAPTP